MTRDVLAWIVPVLTVWLAIGVLTARLFGALVTDEDDQELTKGSRALIEPGDLSVGPLVSDRPVEVGSRGAQPLATHGPGPMPRFNTQPRDAVHSRKRPTHCARLAAGTEHGTQRGPHGGARNAEDAAIWPAQIEYDEENAAQRDGGQRDGDDRQYIAWCDETEQGEDYHEPDDHDLIEWLEKPAARSLDNAQAGMRHIFISIEA